MNSSDMFSMSSLAQITGSDAANPVMSFSQQFIWGP